MELIQNLTFWTLSFANTPFASLALAIFAFVEASFFPIPPDALQIPLSIASPRRSFFYATVTTIASIAGSIFGYYLGQQGGKRFLSRFVNGEKTTIIRAYYQKYDVLVLIVAGFIPIPCKIFTLAAGALKLDFRRFVVATIIGRSLRFYPVGLLIYLYGPSIQQFLNDYFDQVALAALILIVAGFPAIQYVVKLLVHSAKK